ncbi:MAG: T9SS type A sorting domain-containing protein [Flavipsychrobacter sp.]|nr:T9SS type A sorting domain-containing protein [Flavipsychrobacter sp.]
MRRLLLLLSLCISYTAFAQNYNCFTPATRQFFVNSDTNAYYKGGYLRGMRIDSVKQVGNTTVYYPFHTARGTYGYQLPSLDTNGGSWLGKRVVQEPDGTFLFDNYWGDTVIIKTQANVGDTWMLYNDTTHWYYTATMTSKGIMTVLGVPDSEKTIKIAAYKNGSINTADPLNDLNIIITKNHGFAQVCDLYMFPMHRPGIAYSGGFDYYTDVSIEGYSTYIGYYPPNKYNFTYNLVDYHNPTEEEINNFNVGDVFEYNSYSDITQQAYTIDTIANKGIYANLVIEYGINSWSEVSTYDNVITHAFQTKLIYNNTTITVDTTRGGIPEAFMPEDFYHPSGINYYIPFDDSWCYTSSVYGSKKDFLSHAFNPVTSQNDIVQVEFGEFCGFEQFYKLGIGAIESSLCTDPSIVGTGLNLIYAHKRGYPACGNYVSLGVSNITNPLAEIKIFPNPVSDELSIKLPPDHIFKIAIVNSVGQTLYSNPYGKNTEVINIQYLPAGIYIASVTDENGRSSNYKVVVQH